MNLTRYMSAILCALALVLILAKPAEAPNEEAASADLDAWFCPALRAWKETMRRDYPDKSRSVPVAERLCRLPREDAP